MTGLSITSPYRTLAFFRGPPPPAPGSPTVGGYEVLLSRAYAWFGLVGIGAYGTLLTVGVAASIYWMLRRLSGRFWFSCLLAGIVCSGFLFNGMPRPVFFSMMLFCVTLTRLFEAQRSGRIQPLYWLPALFLLWANLHIQFVYGLFVAALFVAVNLAQSLLQALGFASEFISRPTLPARPLIVILALCVVATVIGPNFYHPYLVVLAYSKAKFATALSANCNHCLFVVTAILLNFSLLLRGSMPLVGRKSWTSSN